MTAPRCDMVAACAAPIARIDTKGYIYCDGHGAQRAMSQPCRRLDAGELEQINRGEPIARY